MKYRALVGLDYPPGRRAEPGDVVEDLPRESIGWLLRDGLIEPAEQPAAKPEDKPAKGGA